MLNNISPLKTIYSICILLILSSCSKPHEGISDTPILITNATIVDVRSGSLLKNYQILIDSGKIKKITPEKIDYSQDSILTINAEGKYVMPGLAEMHAHIPTAKMGKTRMKETLFLYLSNGVTTIRGMLGEPEHLKLREEAREGEILSPRIFTASKSLNGGTAKTIEKATSKVIAYQKDGYDLLKIHPGIKREVFDELVKTANEVGIDFAGHVPTDVGVRHAIESGYRSVDHIDGFLEALVPDSLHVNPDHNGFFGYNFAPLADTTKIDELALLTKKSKVWVVPTQSIFERWLSPVSATKLVNEPEMKYMQASTLKEWVIEKNKYVDTTSNFNKIQWNQFNTIRLLLIKKIQEKGYGILLGSDAPQVFNVPGFSIHHEIDGMMRAGLTPLQIIQSGTINPAKYFDMEDTFGEVKEGLDADIILLNENPLNDITALKEISGVIVRGKWIPKETIDSKLAEIAKNASAN